MKKELIAKLFKEFEKACYEYKNIECWSSRDLQEILGYSEWRNFEKVIDKAKTACRNSGQEIDDHFVDVNKMVEIGSRTKRTLEDIALTRYALLSSGKMVIRLSRKLHLLKLILLFKQESKK